MFVVGYGVIIWMCEVGMLKVLVVDLLKGVKFEIVMVWLDGYCNVYYMKGWYVVKVGCD